MKKFNTIRGMRKFLISAKLAGKTIGFVPTMGYLHDGHLSLVKAARARCDIVVVSVFVNPIQFGPKEDFKKYPRDILRDLGLLMSLNVDCVFIPRASDIFPREFTSYIEVKGLSDKLCGSSRPGHFRGVATIVVKLFNIVSPDMAFFGEKDFQQLAVIKKMVSDLNMGVEVVGLPTVREKDGLAMSSRNKYLSKAQRSAAPVLFRSLRLARKIVGEGVLDAKRIWKAMKRLISSVKPQVKVDYIEICDPQTLETKKTAKGKTLIALSAFLGRARLIDNIVVKG